MSSTAQHQVEGRDTSLEVINALSMLDLSQLSYVQLQRLLKALQQAAGDVAQESAQRAGGDNSGDTVKVPSPTNI